MGNIGSHVDLTSVAPRHQANTEAAGLANSTGVRDYYHPVAARLLLHGGCGLRVTGSLARDHLPSMGVLHEHVDYV